MQLSYRLAVMAALFVVPQFSAIGQQDRVAPEVAEEQPPRSAEETAAEYLRRARALVARADSADNAEQADKLRAQARALIASARGIHQRSHDRHKAELEEYPIFIPESEPERRKARAAAEMGYIVAQLDLARCSYELAQTHPEGAAERRAALKKAAGEYGRISQAYRSMGAGLIAELWQGKCFQEMGEIGKAMGIYGTLLEHDSSRSRSLKAIQDQARHFRLICLNDPQRNDFRIVIREATEWLDAFEANAEEKEKARTGVEFGIRWERARACEMLADSADVPADEKPELLQQAIDDARIIRASAAPAREAAARMIERLLRRKAI